MSTTSESDNPDLAEALLNLSESPGLKDYIDMTIPKIGESMKKDTCAYHPPAYSRQSFTIGALLASDQAVRAMASRAGVDIRTFDLAIYAVSQLILAETSRRNVIGEKIIIAIKNSYSEGNYR